jgi:type I restriction enzyme S subunit
MRSPFFQEQLAAVMSQTTRNQVPITKQVELVIALPSPAEQREIVRRAQRLLALADGLTARVDPASKRVDRSSQAVLAKVFRGELIGAGSGPI